MRDQGCDLIQGYHYPPPLADQDFRDYVHSPHAQVFDGEVIEEAETV